MTFVILPVQREVVRVSKCEGERHRVLFHFRQQFQHPPTRSRCELDNFTARAATARVSCRHIPTEADLDQAGPTVTGDASPSLSRRNMRFRHAQRRRGAALGATPPPLAVASCHHIRPQNRRAVVLAVRFCSFYFAAGNGRIPTRRDRAVTFPQAIEFRLDGVSPYRGGWRPIVCRRHHGLSSYQVFWLRRAALGIPAAKAGPPPSRQKKSVDKN